MDYLGYYHGRSDVLGKVLTSGFRSFSFYTLRLLERPLSQGSVVVVDAGRQLIIGIVFEHETKIPVSIQNLPKNSAGLEEILRETGEVEEMITSIYHAASAGYYGDKLVQGIPPSSPLTFQKVYPAAGELLNEFCSSGEYFPLLAGVVDTPQEYAFLILNHLRFLRRYLEPGRIEMLYLDGLRAISMHGLDDLIPAYLRVVEPWVRSVL